MKHKYKTLHLHYQDMCNERNYQYPAYIVKDVSIIHQDGLPYIKVEFNNKRNELLLYERFTTMWWT